MAKARKTVRKTAGKGRKAAAPARKASSTKAGAKKKKKPSRPRANELNLTALKKQLRSHLERLAAGRSTDPRVAEALAVLQRAHSELASACGASMIISLA